MQGTCRCNPPYYGQDCGLFRTPTGSAAVRYLDSPPPDPGLPRVYVYGLPPEFNTHLYYHMALPYKTGTIHPSLGLPGYVLNPKP